MAPKHFKVHFKAHDKAYIKANKEGLALRLKAHFGSALLIAAIGACAAGFARMAVASTAAVANPPVGEATLVIGQARITGSEGAVREVQRGSELRVGDRVETLPGAHVHIRFVDGARVSVRPGSRLTVEQYAQSASAGSPASGGAIKFRLDEGVMRSITGSWGEAARDRFRLNTPVAAIGVKGTDFVVRADGQGTAASVFTGAIVLAPLTDKCAATVGPCLNGSEKLLSADMKGQMLELRRDQAVPQLVPAVDLLALARSGSADSARPEPGRAERPMVADIARSESVLSEKPVVGEQLAAVTIAVANANASAAAEAAAEMARRNAPEQALYWARYPWATALAGDDFTRRFDVALMQGTRSISSDGAFSLRRPESTVFAPQSASAGFQLISSSAGVVRNAGFEVEPVQVSNARLDVDFARSSFATSLTASGPKLGTAKVEAAGAIDSLGAMRSAAGNASVQGGFNGDGYKAGLSFRSIVPGGTLLGVTQWSR